MDRTKQIQRRQSAINRGSVAETALSELDSAFDEIRNILIEQFIKNSKEIGQLDNAIGYEIIALNDVKTRFEEYIKAGKKAAEARRKELESRQNAGGSEI